MAFVIFLAGCGFAALGAAFVIGRLLWRDEQRASAVVISSLTATVGVFCLATAWIWWEGPLL